VTLGETVVESVRVCGMGFTVDGISLIPSAVHGPIGQQYPAACYLPEGEICTRTR
jgi:hypothetical protein